MLTQQDEDAQIVAVLHDVLEDCPPDRKVTAADLRRDGYNEEVIAALEALTKTENEKNDYDAFIERVAKNPLARRVKLADLQDNLDNRRLLSLTDEDTDRMKKYHKAWRRLMTFEA
jgi:(p)ppGpp synthase/HD superfamily hydrolase